MRLIHYLRAKSLITIIIVSIMVILIFMSQYGSTIFFTAQIKTLAKMKLPSPVYSSQTSIEEALKKRRSIRQYKTDSITLQQISQLLWAAQGFNSTNGFRTAPSAGALYPLEIYLVSGKIKGLLPGIYHYLPKEHVLELLIEGDVRQKLAAAALSQRDVEDGAADIIITAAYARTIMKYGNNGKRFVHMEAGHAAQNICLQVISLGLGTVTIGAFNNSEIKRILNLPKDEEPLYIMPIGKI